MSRKEEGGERGGELCSQQLFVFDYPLIINRSGCLSFSYFRCSYWELFTITLSFPFPFPFSISIYSWAATGNYLQLHYHFHYHFQSQSQFILGHSHWIGELKDLQMLYADVVIYVFQDTYNLHDIPVDQLLEMQKCL